MHRIERVDQHGLARRFADLGVGLLVRRHQYAALRVAELDQPVQHGQSGRVGGADRQVELGAANGGGGRQSLNLQQLLVVTDPDFAAQQAQDVLQDVVRDGNDFPRGDLLEFQLAVAIEFDLRAIRQQNRGAAALTGPHHLAGRQ